VKRVSRTGKSAELAVLPSSNVLTFGAAAHALPMFERASRPSIAWRPRPPLAAGPARVPERRGCSGPSPVPAVTPAVDNSRRSPPPVARRRPFSSCRVSSSLLVAAVVVVSVPARRRRSVLPTPVIASLSVSRRVRSFVAPLLVPPVVSAVLGCWGWRPHHQDCIGAGLWLGRSVSCRAGCSRWARSSGGGCRPVVWYHRSAAARS